MFSKHPLILPLIDWLGTWEIRRKPREPHLEHSYKHVASLLQNVQRDSFVRKWFYLESLKPNHRIPKKFVALERWCCPHTYSWLVLSALLSLFKSIIEYMKRCSVIWNIVIPNISSSNGYFHHDADKHCRHYQYLGPAHCEGGSKRDEENFENCDQKIFGLQKLYLSSSEMKRWHSVISRSSW